MSGLQISHLIPDIETKKKNIINHISLLINEPTRYWKSYSSDIHTIALDINYKDYQKLMYWKSQAIQKYTLNLVDHDFVNANMKFNNKIIPVKIRLRGSSANEHMDSQKWSFRVKIKGEDRFLGMKTFSLMDPQRRNFLMEWFLRKFLKKEGIITKKYGFIKVKINGKNKGIYAFDEHFGKQMLESNQRRISPIIRFSDDSFWLEKAAYKQHPNQWGDYYFSSHIDPIDSQTNKDTIQAHLLQEATDILNAFRLGDLKTSQVFDADKLAKAMAIGDLMGGWHGFVVFNCKFYYNPLTRKIEPIPDDSFTENNKILLNTFRLNDKYISGAFLKQIFTDLKFTEKYLNELQRVTDKSYLDSIIFSIRKEIDENINFIRKDYPTYNFPIDEIYSNQKLLNETLNPHRGILAYLKEKNSDTLKLSIAVTKSLPVRIININYDNRIILKNHKEIILRGKDYLGGMNYNEVVWILPDSLKNIKNFDKLHITYQILGTKNQRIEKILAYKAYDFDRLKKNPKLIKPNHSSFSFVNVDSVTKIISIKAGYWELSDNLVIPEGYIFKLNPNTILNQIKSSLIISYSPLLFIGTKEQPINIFSSDSTGRGIAVYADGRKSILENLIVENLKIKNAHAFMLTGALTFYESPVYVNNCIFSNIFSEDVINIINSNFKVENTLFKDSSSDGLDADFSNGKIINSKFIQSGNDGIDISGSTVKIMTSSIMSSKDKGISVGEDSNVEITDSKINDCRVGIAVKDNSSSIIRNTIISNGEYGITAYQKKPEFGPANIILTSIKIDNVAEDYLIEEFSSITNDGSKKNGDSHDVYKILYE